MLKRVLVLLCFLVSAQLMVYAQADSVVQKLRSYVPIDTVKKDSVGARIRLSTKEAIDQDLHDGKSKASQTVDQSRQSTAGQVRKIKAEATAPFKKDRDDVENSAKDLVGKSLTGTTEDEIKKEGDEIKKEGSVVKKEISQLKQELKNELPDSTDLKKVSKQNISEKAEEKVLKLEYNSDDPSKAPWNEKQFSKEDLGDILEKPDQQLPDGEGKVSKVVEKAKKLQAPGASEDAAKESIEQSKSRMKRNKLANFSDSISQVVKTLEGENIQQQLLGAKKIYSEKYINRIADSLGVSRADSLLAVASGFIKTETPKDELMKKINQKMGGKEMQGARYDAEKNSVSMKDGEKLNTLEEQAKVSDLSGLKEGDLSGLKLPAEVLGELPPLPATWIDSKYVDAVDSMRDIILKSKNYKLDERNITEVVKQTALKKKPSFLDKSYGEMIIGYFADSSLQIFQLSPALAYHLTKHISFGLGPNISIEIEKQTRINLRAGFRSFVKAEFWKQRMYFQVEDSVEPVRVNTELSQSVRRLNHQLLGGVGGILPLTKSLGINVSILHRLTSTVNDAGKSPWVFRVGFSSIKKK